MEQYYKIANLLVKMDSFGRTVAQAEKYLAEPGEPDVVIRSNRGLVKERAPHLSDDDCEYLATGGSFYQQLLSFDGMMLHASAVVMDGKAYLFTANSGTGKSTHTGLWLRQFGERAWLLNDDKPALRLENGLWYAYGTPWSGKHDLSRNEGAVLAGICCLSRGETNSICPLDTKTAIFRILEQTARPPVYQLREKLLELMDSLITKVPIWTMACNMEPEAALMSYQAMSGANQKENG